MAHWIMVIDLAKCNGCERCVAGCSQGNQLPIGIAWRRVAVAEMKVDGTTRHVSVPMSCMHCANAPCEDVCPTGATHHLTDGIVDVDHDRCIGCGFCMVACPYQARSMISPGDAKLSTAFQANSGIEAARTLQQGTCTKCDMCRSKVETGLERGLVPGNDRAATPNCVNACLWNAIQFGDAHDPNSSVSRSLRENRAFRIHEELGTAPSIYYIYNEDRQNGLATSESSAVTITGDGVNLMLLKPQHQSVWTRRAVINFTLGAAGAALYVLMTWLGLIVSGISSVPPPVSLQIISSGLVVLGLLAVASEAGRPVRARFLLTNLRRSWMSRETLAAGIFLSCSLAGLFIQHPFLVWFGCLAAISFIVAQALVISQARAVPAWTSFWIPFVFIVSAFTGASGILLVTGPNDFVYSHINFSLGLTVCIAADMIAWSLYITDSRSPACYAATAPLRTRSSVLWLLGFFRLLPMVMLLALFAAHQSPMPRLVAVAIGVALFAGTWAEKSVIIRQCGFVRPVELKLNKDPWRLSSRPALAPAPVT